MTATRRGRGSSARTRATRSPRSNPAAQRAAAKKPAPKKPAPKKPAPKKPASKKPAPKKPAPKKPTPEQHPALLHDLRVHQIELELQNEELRRTQLELEASRTRYFELYDLAPVGYLTLSDKGQILEANLTAASLLGVTRSALGHQMLTHFVLPEDQDIFYHHRAMLFGTGEPQSCELRLLRQGAPALWARLQGTLGHDEAGAPLCRLTFSDISRRKLDAQNLAE
ncbi:MAG: PAS domain-containing protein, partial [Pseudomonadota bacterium]